MENRLKVRLTGAAILVALVVLLVPEMFRGERTHSTPPSTPADGPPVRAYTIELNGRSAAPLQNAAAPEVPAAAAPSAPAALAVPAVTATPAAPAAPAAPAVAVTPPAPAAPAAPPTVSPSVAAARDTASGRWMVQLGLFAKHDNAERLAREAQAKGFAVQISGADAHGLYRVHTAPFGDRTRALALQQQLKAQGFAASVTAP